MALQAILRRLLPDSHQSALDTVEQRLLPVAGREAGGHPLSAILGALLRLVRHNDAVRSSELSEIRAASRAVLDAIHEHEYILLNSEQDDIDLKFDVHSSHDWFDGDGMRRMRGIELRNMSRDALPLMRCCMATYGWQGAIFFHSFNMEAAATEMDAPSQLARGLSGDRPEHAGSANDESGDVRRTRSANPASSASDQPLSDSTTQSVPVLESASGKLPTLSGDTNGIFSMATRAAHFMHTMANAALGDRHTVAAQLGLPSSSDVLYLHGEWKSPVGRTIQGVRSAMAGIGSVMSTAVGSLSSMGGSGAGAEGANGTDGASTGGSQKSRQHVEDWHKRETTRVAGGGSALNGYTLPKHMLLADHARKRLVLAVRGTMSVTDLVTDLTAAHMPFLGGEAHEGMATSAHALYQSALRGPVPAAVEAEAAAEAAIARVSASTAHRPSGIHEINPEGLGSSSSAHGSSMHSNPGSEACVDGDGGDGTDAVAVSPLDDELIAKTMQALQDQGSLALDFWLRDVYPGYGLAITGHSLGGGVAALFTMLLLDSRANTLAGPDVKRHLVPFADVEVSCFAFGPPPVFSPLSEVSDEMHRSIHCVVHEDDAVPRLSLLTVRELLQLLGKVCDAEPGFVEELLREDKEQGVGGAHAATSNSGGEAHDGHGARTDEVSASQSPSDQSLSSSQASIEDRLEEGGEVGAAIGSLDVEPNAGAVGRDRPPLAPRLASSAAVAVTTPSRQPRTLKSESGIVTASSLHRTVSRLASMQSNEAPTAPESPSLSVASHSARPPSERLDPTPRHDPMPGADAAEVPLELHLSAAADASEGGNRGAVGLDQASVDVDDASVAATADPTGGSEAASASGSLVQPDVEATLSAILSEVQGQHDRMFQPGQIYLLRTPPPCSTEAAEAAFGAHWPGAASRRIPIRVVVSANQKQGESNEQPSRSGVPAAIPGPAAVPDNLHNDSTGIAGASEESHRKDRLTAAAEGTRPWFLTRTVASTANAVRGIASGVATTVSAPYRWIRGPGDSMQPIPVGPAVVSVVSHAKAAHAQDHEFLDFGGDGNTDNSMSDVGDDDHHGNRGDTSNEAGAAEGFTVRQSSLRMARLLDEIDAIEDGADVASEGGSDDLQQGMGTPEAAGSPRDGSTGSSPGSTSIRSDEIQPGQIEAAFNGAVDNKGVAQLGTPNEYNADGGADRRGRSPRSRRSQKEPIEKRVGKLRRTQSMDSVQSFDKGSPASARRRRRREAGGMLAPRSRLRASPGVVAAPRRIAWAIEPSASSNKAVFVGPSAPGYGTVDPPQLPAAPALDRSSSEVRLQPQRIGLISAHSTSALASLAATASHPQHSLIAQPLLAQSGSTGYPGMTIPHATGLRQSSDDQEAAYEEREVDLGLQFESAVPGIQQGDGRDRALTQPSFGSRIMAMVSFSGNGDLKQQPQNTPDIIANQVPRSSSVASRWQWGFPSLGIGAGPRAQDPRSSAASSQSSTTLDSVGQSESHAVPRSTAGLPLVVSHGSGVARVAESSTVLQQPRGTASTMLGMLWNFGSRSGQHAATGQDGRQADEADSLTGEFTGTEGVAPGAGVLVPRYTASVTTAADSEPNLTPRPADDPERDRAAQLLASYRSVSSFGSDHADNGPQRSSSARDAGGSLAAMSPSAVPPADADARWSVGLNPIAQSPRSPCDMPADAGGSSHDHEHDHDHAHGSVGQEADPPAGLSGSSTTVTVQPGMGSADPGFGKAEAPPNAVNGSKPRPRDTGMENERLGIQEAEEGRPSKLSPSARLVPRYNSSEEVNTPVRRSASGGRVGAYTAPSDLFEPGSAIRRAGDPMTPEGGIASAAAATAAADQRSRELALSIDGSESESEGGIKNRDSDDRIGTTGAGRERGRGRGSGRVAVRLDWDVEGCNPQIGAESSGSQSRPYPGQTPSSSPSSNPNPGPRPRGGGPWPHFAPCIGAQVTNSHRAGCLRDVIPTSRSIPDHMPDRYLLLCRRLHEWYVEVPPAVEMAVARRRQRSATAGMPDEVEGQVGGGPQTQLEVATGAGAVLQAGDAAGRNETLVLQEGSGSVSSSSQI